MSAIRISDSVALVTGANRGIGRALVNALLSRGAKRVYATARDVTTLRDLDDARVVKLVLDVTDAAQLQAVQAATPDLTLIVNNAGVALAAGLGGPTLASEARREMDVNYFGPLQVLQQLAPTLARNGGGAVVNIGSAAGLTNMPFLPTYSASKAALHSLTQAARMLYAAQSTKVFGVYAGPVDTDMARGLNFPKTSPDVVAAAVLDGIETGQLDIFPDPFAVDFGQRYQASPKASEQQVTQMLAAAAS